MIDKDQLKQLGWSDELIREVTRVSLQINDPVKDQPSIHEPIVTYSAESGSSIYFNASDLNTSIHIRVADKNK